jgi:hypothetical protein
MRTVFQPPKGETLLEVTWATSMASEFADEDPEDLTHPERWYAVERALHEGSFGELAFDRPEPADHPEELAYSADEVSAESVRTYLGVYGDAVQFRVDACIGDARGLLAERRYGLALARAATAVELVVGYLVVRPCVQGAFPSEAWAEILTRRIVGGRNQHARELLPILVGAWGLSLDTVRVEKSPAWDVWTEDLVGVRNGYLHQDDAVTRGQATTAIKVAVALSRGLMSQLAERLELDWPSSDWHSAVVSRRSDLLSHRHSPFEMDRRSL